MQEATIKDAPQFLNANDQAMWVRGYNEAVLKMQCKGCAVPKDGVYQISEPAAVQQGVPKDGFELWWADHMPKSTQTEAWSAWVALHQSTHPTQQGLQPFQERVGVWLMECFGHDIAHDGTERNHRFLEESLELVQSLGCTASEAHQLVDYVFNRPIGEPKQELGGVMVTLAALCFAHGLDMQDGGEMELARISVPEIMAKVKAKQAAKPKHSPLPQHPTQQGLDAETQRNADIGAAVQRACKELPEGAGITISLERGAGMVEMIDWDGNEFDHFDEEHEDFACRINAAIDGAIAAEQVAAQAKQGEQANG